MPTNSTARRTLLLCLLLAGATPLGTTAQEAPPSWQSQLELGFNGASGNSSFAVLRTGGSLKYLRTDVAEFELSALFRYGKNDEKVISNDLRTSLKFDWHPQSDFSPFIFVAASRDVIRRIDLKMNGGAGAKWTFFRREQSKVSLSGAAVWDYEKFRVAEGSGDPGSEGAMRLSARFKADHRFGSGATFQHVTFWQPAVTDFGDYNVEMTNSLTTRLLSRFSLGVEHEYVHDEVPPPGVKKDDQKFSVVLRVSL